MAWVDAGDTAHLARSARAGLATTFGATPATVGRAPGRVNLIGEHTDYNRGRCLPMALPHATYAACTLTDTAELRVASRLADSAWQGRISDIGPGTVDGWAAYVAGVIWALADCGIVVPGLDVYVESTVPLGAGLSSSAALECAVAVAVVDLLGQELDQETRRTLVAACIRAETEVAGAPTGGLDQSVSMLAAADHALLIDFDDDTTEAIPLPLAQAGLTLLVIDTKVSHALIDGGYGARRADCETAADRLGLRSLREADVSTLATLTDPRLQRRAHHVVSEIARVGDTVAALREADWAAVGELFLASHASLRDDFEVSCPELDLAVDVAMTAGALGARMTGGGFGGSAIALVPTGAVDAVVAAVGDEFAEAGWAPPDLLSAHPAPAAGPVSGA